jgi:hypothetical protein
MCVRSDVGRLAASAACALSQPALKIEGEAVRSHPGSRSRRARERSSLDQRQIAVSDMDRHAGLKIEVSRPPASEHGYLDDQATRLDALRVSRAAAVLDHAISTDPCAVDGCHLPQAYRPFHRACRSAADKKRYDRDDHCHSHQ